MAKKFIDLVLLGTKEYKHTANHNAYVVAQQSYMITKSARLTRL